MKCDMRGGANANPVLCGGEYNDMYVAELCPAYSKIDSCQHAQFILDADSKEYCPYYAFIELEPAKLIKKNLLQRLKDIIL